MVLRRIEGYLRKTGKSPTWFGRTLANDPRLVFDIVAEQKFRTIIKRPARTRIPTGLPNFVTK